MDTNTPSTLPTDALARARGRGLDAANAAASWVTDGNDTSESRQRLLLLLEHGDPEADAYLPRRPDLSGEWADDLTPLELAREVLGSHDPDPDHVDALAEAFEQAVSDRFEDACTAELRRWGALTGDELTERYG